MTSDEQEKICVRKCIGKPRSDCCKYDCTNEIDGTIIDGKFHGENFIKSFELYFNETKSSSFGDWKPVIEKSYEACLKLSKNS